MADQKADPKPPATTQRAPDPDEDDLDDLDDVLDNFQPTPSNPGPAPPTNKPPTTTPAAAAAPAPAAENASNPPVPTTSDLTDAQLNTHLQDGMASLASELGDDPAMQKQFEEMMAELIKAGQSTTGTEASAHVDQATAAAPREMPAADGGKEANFQESIRRTMERMQASGDKATAASSSSAGGAGRGGGGGGGGGDEEEMLAALMRELGAGGGGLGGEGGGEEDFNSMLMGMMAQLTHKEILYEPMKDLREKYPAWLEKHRGETGEEELARYREQEGLVGEIVGRFERKGYSDEDEEDRAFIVERMQKMQALGSPPSDLVGDMNAAQEAMGEMDQGCPTQ